VRGLVLLQRLLGVGCTVSVVTQFLDQTPLACQGFFTFSPRLPREVLFCLRVRDPCPLQCQKGSSGGVTSLGSDVNVLPTVRAHTVTSDA